MKTAVAHLKSLSPYSQSKRYMTEKLDRESSSDYEKRTWRDRLHTVAEVLGGDPTDTRVCIPPMAFKNSVGECAKYIGMQIPGKGKSTYTKHFEAGMMVLDPLILDIRKEDVPGQWVFVPADGVRGSGKRVDKCFPVIREWEGKVTFLIFDEIITETVFKKHLEDAGKFIGLGYWRPRNNGLWGRFEVLSVEWS